MPYLAQTNLFNEFDFDHPWDTPRNEYLCREPIWLNLNPGIPTPVTTAEGYSLLHYEMNPNVTHRNHCVKYKDMTAGTANTWVIGEASGDFLPWAYPFNWRSLGESLNGRLSGYGRLDQNSTQFGMADGSVRTLSKDIDPQLLRQLAEAPPVATLERIAVPERPTVFRYSGNEREFGIVQHGNYWPTAYVNRRNGTREIEIWVSGKGGGAKMPRPSYEVVRDIAEHKTPETTALAGPIILDETIARLLARLPQLQTLQVKEVVATPEVIQFLRSMTKLKTLQAASFEGDDQAKLQAALPHIAITRHSRHFGFRAEK